MIREREQNAILSIPQLGPEAGERVCDFLTMTARQFERMHKQNAPHPWLPDDPIHEKRLRLAFEQLILPDGRTGVVEQYVSDALTTTITRLTNLSRSHQTLRQEMTEYVAHGISVLRDLNPEAAEALQTRMDNVYDLSAAMIAG